MADIIRLLPDHVANQIAAGEVVQRPASVVKELLENAIDAGASVIQLVLKDAGRTLIQVTDNGTGMSETDARLSFERHATSKIGSAEDLFSIHTLGFRGEALASIASVAQVEVRTRRQSDELGIAILIEGSRFISQTPVNIAPGTTFAIKNLFFNIPARRNFLKNDAVEMRHCIEEFERVVLVHPQIEFSLEHNGKVVFHLPVSSLRHRVVNVFGAALHPRLVPIEQESDIVSVSGFIGKPEFARKTRGEQYFFVNDRYVKMPYLAHAVESAYQELIPEKSYPSYFIYLQVDPASLDVNIHPTKTEVKMIDEGHIYAILKATVRKSLGEFNLMPSLDFDREAIFDIPEPDPDNPPSQPAIRVNPEYNPFTNPNPGQSPSPMTGFSGRTSPAGWEKLFPSRDFERLPNDLPPAGDLLPSEPVVENKVYFSEGSEKPFVQLMGRYLLTTLRNGLLLVDQQRAHERILYERFLSQLQGSQSSSQQLLFPLTFYFQPSDAELLKSLMPELRKIGFDIESAGQNNFAVNGLPAGFRENDAGELLEQLVSDLRQSQGANPESHLIEMAAALARNQAVRNGTLFSAEEIKNIFDSLFACNVPHVSPDGRLTLKMLNADDLDKLLK